MSSVAKKPNKVLSVLFFIGICSFFVMVACAILGTFVPNNKETLKSFEVLCSDRSSDLNKKLKEMNPKSVSAPAIHAFPIVCVTVER